MNSTAAIQPSPSSQNARTVLVVDDEPGIRELVREILESGDPRYRVIEAGDGLAGHEAALRESVDLVILDLRMPVLGGLEACKLFRKHERTRHLPVVVLTANHDEPDRVALFEQGADDFIPKPFHPQELRARISSKIRRLDERDELVPATSRKNDAIVCGNLRLEPQGFQAFVDDRRVDLGLVQFRLICCLARHVGQVLSRHEILREVWKDVTVSSRTVDAHIVALRRALGSFDHQIETIYGVGYLLRPHGQ